MLCPKCGKEIQQGDVICLNCGNLLTSVYNSQDYNSQTIQPNETVSNSNYNASNNQIGLVDDNIIDQTISNVDQTIEPVSQISETVVPLNMYDNQNVSTLNDNLSNDIPKFDISDDKEQTFDPFNGFGMIDTVSPEQMAAMEMNSAEITTDQIINDGYVSNISTNQDSMSSLVSDIQNSQVVQPVSYVEPVGSNTVSNVTNDTQSANIIPSVIPPVESVVQMSETVVPEVTTNKVVSKNTKTKKDIKRKEKKNINKKGLFIILGVVLSILIVSIVSYYYIFSKSPSEYILNNDKFPSITAVIGSRKLESTSTSNDGDIIIKKYHYTKVKNVMNDLAYYTDYLTQSLKFVNTTAYDLNEEIGTLQLGNESVTGGYVIIVTIEYNIDEYTITIKRAPGTLTRY